MAKSLQDILGWVALTKAVTAVKDGIPNPFPPFLFRVKEENKVVGDSFKFNRMYGQRKTARASEYGASARRRGLQKEEVVDVKMLHFYEEQPIPPLIMQQLRDYDSYDNQRKGMRVIAHNVKTFGTLFGNARILSVASSLCQGAIYLDGDGNILPTSSGAVKTVSQQVPANNVGAVVDAAGANIFGATGRGSWAVPSTDIPLQLRILRKTAAVTHGYTPRIALYGENVPSHMTQNDFVLDYLAREGSMRPTWLKDNTIPDGLFGLTWVPVWEFGYEDSTDVKRTPWGANTIAFLPGEEDLDSWYALAEGSYLVPRTINLVADAAAAMGQMEQVFGPFGYGALTHNPPSICTYMGDTFLPAFRLPEVVYIADVVA